MKHQTVWVFNIQQANVLGIKRYKAGAIGDIAKRIFQDTQSWTKTVAAMRKSYNIGLRLDVRNI